MNLRAISSIAVAAILVIGVAASSGFILKKHSPTPQRPSGEFESNQCPIEGCSDAASSRFCGRESRLSFIPQIELSHDNETRE